MTNDERIALHAAALAIVAAILHGPRTPGDPDEGTESLAKLTRKEDLALTRAECLLNEARARASS
jgi:hypothetical protein